MSKPIRNLRKSNKNKKRVKTLATFLRGLSRRKLRGLDGLAIALHKEAFKKIDCLDCAHCCKVMTPTFKPADIKRISKHLGMTYQEYQDKYLYKDETGDWMNTKTPCQHLRKDNKCAIYPVRPKDCSEFPHTQNREFKAYIASTHIQNIEYCPATLHVVERMHQLIIEQGKKNLSAADVKVKQAVPVGYPY